MANVKIPELSALTSPSPSDLVPVADVSTANDEVKKTTVGEVVGKITGDVDVATDGTATITVAPLIQFGRHLTTRLICAMIYR